ncbi:MAG: ABC transporter ATP-binding protein [Pseudomonadota bacterium]
MKDTMTDAMPAVEVRGLAKHYGPVRALDGVDVTIQAGEYFVLLGPSGGGKTTLLRTIGGFHRPTAGTVRLHGQDVSDLPPEKRPTGMVFQQYALFPHMTVERNVGYGLSLQKRPKSEISDKVSTMLDQVGLSGLSGRKPHELSGGQQQRVQLARALVLDRDILLLDEPLAALDAQLRKDMCLELKHLQEQVGVTFIHVTHNQEEAMTVANRIALIADGKLVEHGTAQQIYEAPRQRFTASFVGENNLIPGTVLNAEPPNATIETGAGAISVACEELVRAGDKVTFSIRSELVSIGPEDGAGIPATHAESVYLGLTTSHRVHLADGTEIVSRVLSSNGPSPEPGTPVTVSWPQDGARLHLD